MTKQHTGSCLCGQVQYEVAGTFDRFYLCHCARCRKDTGSAHAANLFSAAGRLTWSSGEGLVRAFLLPGTRHARSFCTVCGSALPYIRPDGIVVPAGSLDTDVDRIPDGRIFTASRASWDRDLDSVTGYDSLPE